MLDDSKQENGEESTQRHTTTCHANIQPCAEQHIHTRMGNNKWLLGKTIAPTNSLDPRTKVNPLTPVLLKKRSAHLPLISQESHDGTCPPLELSKGFLWIQPKWIKPRGPRGSSQEILVVSNKGIRSMPKDPIINSKQLTHKKSGWIQPRGKPRQGKAKPRQAKASQSKVKQSTTNSVCGWA